MPDKKRKKNQNKLVEIHEKYPTNKGHKKINK